MAVTSALMSGIIGGLCTVLAWLSGVEFLGCVLIYAVGTFGSFALLMSYALTQTGDEGPLFDQEIAADLQALELHGSQARPRAERV